MQAFELAKPGRKLSLLCLGAHSDDIEIGAGGLVLTLLASGAEVKVHWCVLSAAGIRAEEARASARDFLTGAADVTIELGGFRDSYFPYDGSAMKQWVEGQCRRVSPDIILTHRRDDAHQDHRFVSELTWNAFRNHLILEYEVPKWDGDFGSANCYAPMSEGGLARKISLLEKHFVSQRSKDWFSAKTFRALAVLRGMEARAPYAEAFVVRKLMLHAGALGSSAATSIRDQAAMLV